MRVIAAEELGVILLPRVKQLVHELAPDLYDVFTVDTSTDGGVEFTVSLPDQSPSRYALVKASEIADKSYPPKVPFRLLSALDQEVLRKA